MFTYCHCKLLLLCLFQLGLTCWHRVTMRKRVVFVLIFLNVPDKFIRHKSGRCFPKKLVALFCSHPVALLWLVLILLLNVVMLYFNIHTHSIQNKWITTIPTSPFLKTTPCCKTWSITKSFKCILKLFNFILLNFTVLKSGLFYTLIW